MEIVAADIGGTNARFALAEIDEARVVSITEPAVSKTAAHSSLQAAWNAFAAQVGRPLPRHASIAIAAPLHGDLLKLTNSPWVIRVSELKRVLKLDELVILNDFAAMAHAVAQLDEDLLRHVCGADEPLPREGVISVVGPGTGLGVAQLVRRENSYEVLSTEGGHIGFAPFDKIEDRILDHLRRRYPRVSVERIVSGPGMLNIYEALAAIEGAPPRFNDDKALWTAALAGEDALAEDALERFCLCFGVLAGDMALAHGARAVAIASGLSLRLGDRLARSGFSQRFAAKGRFESVMQSMPVRRVTHPQPGLYGAAAAFVHHRSKNS